MFLTNDSIFIKIFKTLFFAIVSFTTIFAIYSISNQKDQIHKSMNLQANSYAKMIINYSSDAIVSHDSSFLVDFYYKFLKENDSLSTLIINTKNENIIVRKEGWTLNEKINEEFSKLELQSQKSKIIEIDNKIFFHYVYPINLLGSNWGWLHMNMPLEDYYNKLENMYISFFTFFVFLVFLSFLISYIVAKGFSKPIVELSKIANEISNGNLELRSNYHSKDEIGQLSNAFNKMISNIEESKLELQKSYDDLEESVKNRTLELHIANKNLEKNRITLEELNINLDKKVKIEVEKRTNQESLLIQQSRLAAMGEMIGNIAHQWRQPLSVVTTAASGIKMEKEFGLSNEKSEIEKLDVILNTSNFLSNTIEDFSNFFKPNKNRVDFNINLNAEKTLELVSASLKFNHINVIKNYKDIDLVYGFPNEYSQAVLNILTNAKDVLVSNQIQNPTISIKTYQLDSYGYIEIEDNAGGIKESILDKIFDPYFSTKHKSQGTGIGLYMSKMIIEQNMNGKLYAKNNEEGAVFIISIPIV